MEISSLLGFGLILVGVLVLRIAWMLFCLWLYDSYGYNIGKIDHLYHKVKERL